MRQGLFDQVASRDDLPSNLPPWAMAEISRAGLIAEKGHAFASRGMYREAFRCFDQAKEIFSRWRIDLWVADMLGNMGLCCHESGRYDEAIECFSSAKELLSSYSDERGIRRLGLIYLNEGKSLLHLNEIDSACKLINISDEAISIFQQLDSPFDIAEALKGKALALTIKGPWEDALQCYDEAERALEQAGLSMEAGGIKVNNAMLLLSVDERARAKRLLKEVIADSRPFANPGSPTGQVYQVLPGDILPEHIRDEKLAKSHWASAAMILAALCEDGEIEARIALINEAIPLFEELGWTEKAAYAQVGLANAYAHQGQLQTAADILNHVEQFYDANHNKQGLAYVDGIRALLCKRSENLQKAEKLLRRCLRILKRLSAPSTQESWKLAQVLVERADQYMAESKKRKAMRIYGEACELYSKVIDDVESARSKMQSESLRTGFFGKQQIVYEESVRLCMKVKDYETAFNYVERAKSRTLVEMMARILPNLPEPDDENVRELWRKIIQLGRTEQVLENQRGDSRSRQSIHTVRGKRHRLEDELYAHAPEFLSLEKVDALSLKDICKGVLDEETALLEYYQADQNLFAFVVDKDGIQACEEIPLAPEFDIEKRKDFWSPTVRGGEVLPFDERLSEFKRAYKYLFPKSVRGGLHIGQKDKTYKRLIIVPHGGLHRLAFHVLTEDGKTFLIDEFEKGIVYAPSATSLSYCQSDKKKHGVPQNAFVLANPTGDLHYAEEEGKNLERFYKKPNVHACYGSDATLEELRDNAGKYDATIVLTHGLHIEQDKGNPMDSHFLLANGEFTVQDWYSIRELGTLLDGGFCFSWQVTPRPGDEVIAISRGAFLAGTPSLLGALWAVPDHPATVFFKEEFHRLWHEKGDKCWALKEAAYKIRQMSAAEAIERLKEMKNGLQLDGNNDLQQSIEEEILRLRQRDSATKCYNNPFYWAHFILLGDWR